MHKSATKCNETIGKWCKNKHGASKIMVTFETYQPPPRSRSVFRGGVAAQSTPAQPPYPALQGATAGPPNISVRSPGPVSSSVAAVAGVDIGGASPVVLVVPACQGLGGGPVVGEASGTTVRGPGPSVPSPSLKVSSPAHSPSSPVFASCVRGVVYKWLWVPDFRSEP
jgi:hypothetical protein